MEVPTDVPARFVRFTAPEVLRGSRPTPASDVFTFGSLLYQLATGRAPFADARDDVAADLIMRGERPELPTDLPAQLRLLVRRCWSHDPADRPMHVEFIHDLQVMFLNAQVPWAETTMRLLRPLTPLTPVSVASPTSPMSATGGAAGAGATASASASGSAAVAVAAGSSSSAGGATGTEAPVLPPPGAASAVPAAARAGMPAAELSNPARGARRTHERRAHLMARQVIQDAAAGAGLSMTTGVASALLPATPTSALHTRMRAAQTDGGPHTSRHYLAEAMARGPLPPIGEWSEQMVVDLVRRMRHYRDGIALQDRFVRLRSQRQCFTGTEAVTWMMGALKLGARIDAVDIGQFLLERQIIQLVSGDDRFADDSTVLRFATRRQVVIIGGGFAGSKVAQALEERFDVTLIDARGAFQCTPSLPSVLVDPAAHARISAPHEKYLRQCRVVKGRAAAVSEHFVTLEDGQRVEYEFLVLCTGSRYEMPFMADHVVNCIDYNEICDRYSSLLTAKHVAVIGGGLVGVEVAGEVAARFPEKQVTLVSRSRLLGRCCEDAHAKCLAQLIRLRNVSVVLGEAAVSIDGQTIVTDKGSRITCDLVYPCLGGVPNTEFLRSRFDASMTATGYMKVDPQTLQVLGHENVFALGDIADLPEEKLAQTAEAHADIVISNIRALDRREQLRAYTAPASRLLIISVGPKQAVMVNGGTVLTDGIIASKIKAIVAWKTMRRVE